MNAPCPLPIPMTMEKECSSLKVQAYAARAAAIPSFISDSKHACTSICKHSCACGLQFRGLKCTHTFGDHGSTHCYNNAHAQAISPGDMGQGCQRQHKQPHKGCQHHQLHHRLCKGWCVHMLHVPMQAWCHPICLTLPFCCMGHPCHCPLSNAF